MPDFGREGALFLAALSQLVTDRPEAEYGAREFLATKHEYRDYIRLMLSWYLARKRKLDQATAYLDERWRAINPASWSARLAQGDTQVWRAAYRERQAARAASLEPIAARGCRTRRPLRPAAQAPRVPSLRAQPDPHR